MKKNGKFYVFPLDYDGDVPEDMSMLACSITMYMYMYILSSDDVGFFAPYDVIIRCLGFKV